jgi:hypothetical protein
VEIRSYRRVFDLERRIYRIDQLRLNPGGVPVRGIAYFLLVSGLALVVARIPLLGALAAPFPWYVRDLAFPLALASLMTVTRIDGRQFDVALRALLRYSLEPRRAASLRMCSAHEARASRWHPPELLMLADGSHNRLRRLRYRGPGAAHLVARHECEQPRTTGRRLGRPDRRVVLGAPKRSGEGVAGSVIVLERGAHLRIR